MALPPLSFQTPPRQRSVIEEAFGHALSVAATQLISAPFEKKREARQLAAEKELAQTREDIRFQNLPREMELSYDDWLRRTRQATREEISNMPLVAETKARAALAARDVMSTRNVSPNIEMLIDRVQRGAGGFSEADIAKPTTLADLEDITPLLNSAISAGNLGVERERNRLQQEGMRDIREANLFPALTEEDLGLAFVNTETGNPLSTLDIQLLKAGVRGQITTAPEFAKYKARALELQRLKEQGKLQQVQFTPKNLQAISTMYTGMQAGQALMQAARSYPFLLWKTPSERIDTGNEALTTSWMSGNRDLIEALAASQLNRDMDQVIQAEKTGAAPQLSARALGYLSLIYRHYGRPSEHPNAEIPAEIPESQLRELGETRMRATSSRGTASSEDSFAPGGTGNLIRGRGPLYAGLDVSVGASDRYPEYLDLARDVETLLRSGPKRGNLPYDSTLYNTMESDFIQQHATPEKARKLYLDMGVPEAQLDDLVRGDSASRQLALDKRLNFILGVLQTARDAIKAK